MASGAACVRAGDRRDEDSVRPTTPPASPTSRRCTASARCSIRRRTSSAASASTTAGTSCPGTAGTCTTSSRSCGRPSPSSSRPTSSWAARTSPRRGPCPTGTTPSRASTSSRSSSPRRSGGTASRTPSSIRAVTPASTSASPRVDPRVSVPGPGVLRQPFSSTSSRVATFGGSASGWQHFREAGATAGGVEGTPHNVVHGFVGGNMLDFATAGLDPDLLAPPLQHRSLLGGAGPRLRSHGVGDHQVRLQGRHQEVGPRHGRRLRRPGRPAWIPLRRHR